MDNKYTPIIKFKQTRYGSNHWIGFSPKLKRDVNLYSDLEYANWIYVETNPEITTFCELCEHWIETIRAADDEVYLGVVFEGVKGIHLPLDKMMYRHVQEWGRSLATLHVLSESYPSRGGSWIDTLAFVSSILQRYPHEQGAQQELEQLRGQLSELPVGVEHMGLIHYDFETDNIFYEEEQSRYCVIDFDDAMIHWYAMDIASAISDLSEQENDDARRKIEHFLTGYRSVKSLDERFVRLLPLFARLLRSVNDLNIHGSREWAVKLRDKLMRACDRIRENFRPTVKLKPIDQSNWYACTQLEVTEEEKRVFPVPTVYWLAESAYCGFTPLAVYSGEQLVVLAVYAVDPDDGDYWIMAYMIDHKFQHRGFGRSGMEELIRYIKEKHVCDKIVLGHQTENERASNLYVSLGFQEVDRNDREIIRELRVSK